MTTEELTVKDLAYYLALNYITEITPIPVELGGGYDASIPAFGGNTCSGWGINVQDAYDYCHKEKKILIEDMLEDGEEIPEPEVEG